MAFPALHLDDRLRSIPGFSLFRRTSPRVANPTTQGVTLRGPASRVRAARTCSPTASPPTIRSGWVYWNRIPVAAINRIEVLRGVERSARQ